VVENFSAIRLLLVLAGAGNVATKLSETDFVNLSKKGVRETGFPIPWKYACPPVSSETLAS
jgi:hypothetical protein